MTVPKTSSNTYLTPRNLLIMGFIVACAASYAYGLGEEINQIIIDPDCANEHLGESCQADQDVFGACMETAKEACTTIPLKLSGYHFQGCAPSMEWLHTFLTDLAYIHNIAEFDGEQTIGPQYETLAGNSFHGLIVNFFTIRGKEIEAHIPMVTCSPAA